MVATLFFYMGLCFASTPRSLPHIFETDVNGPYRIVGQHGS